MILVVEDDDSYRRVVATQLSREGYDVWEAGDGEAALELLVDGSVDLIVTDLQMPNMGGLELLAEITAGRPDIPVIILTAHATVENAVEALRRGAVDYLTKPVERDDLLNRVGRALELEDLRRENRRLQAMIQVEYDLEGMVGRSRRMQEVYAIARRVAATDTTVLIYGESGTGKELLARAIHQNSRRADGNFVPINCGAIPEALLESELFGHRKGSFTGAIRDNEGRFRVADGGTIFLDEVAELPLQMQVKLLRVLQERTVDTIGADAPIAVDVRVIAATNQDLQLAMEEGRFREDLFYRLSVVPIVIPPLRARQQDIPLLFDHFLRQSCRNQGRSMIEVEPAVLERLLEHPWPGNVRELENLAERLVVLTDRDRIGLSDLPDTISSPEPAAGRLIDGLVASGTPLADIEQEILSAALESNDWNQTRTARNLGITRNTLIYRMRKYGLQRPARNKTE